MIDQNVAKVRKVLCIDDEEMIRRTICDYLEDSGFEIYEADCGETGLKLVETLEPDVLLLDLHMPGLSGLEVLSILKKSYPDMGVIIVSGAGEIRYAIDALRLGAWDFVTKPISDMEVLVHAINQALEKIQLRKRNREHEENLEKLVRKQSAALAESEAKYRGLYYNSGDAFLLMDRAGHFRSGNPAITRMFGLDSESEFKQKHFLQLSPEIQSDGSTTLERFEAEVARTIDKGSNFFEWEFARPDGSFFYATVMLTKIDIAGQTELQATVRDISRQKQTEDELRQAQKMEIIGNLAGGLAHDFNNMLSGIVGTVSLMRYQIDSKLEITPESLEEYISMIEHSSDRAAGLVQQLLSLSRKQAFKIVTMELNTIIRQLVKILKNTVDKSVEIETETVEGAIYIKGDPIQIEQVLLNICINGVHAMTTMREPDSKPGGTLTISVTRIEGDRFFRMKHSEALDADYWNISIRDTGIGMSKAVLDKIFAPFFTTKKKGVGTGLGLSMVYNTIKEHQGITDIYSEPGIGTTFQVYLPCPESDVDEIRAATEREQILKGDETVMVVDDEKLLRDIAGQILKSCGYDVLYAENGRVAVEMLKSRLNRIDLVLLDMSMPLQSGKETFVAMKALQPDIRVLLTSGFKQDERVSEALSMGVKGFLQKPYTIRSLSRMVREILK